MLYFILNYAITPHMDWPAWRNLAKVFCTQQAVFPPQLSWFTVNKPECRLHREVGRVRGKKQNKKSSVQYEDLEARHDFFFSPQNCNVGNIPQDESCWDLLFILYLVTS